MSGKLICNVYGCVNNINGLCSSSKIHIDGKQAGTSKETQCNNFDDKTIKSAASNLINLNLPGEIRQLINKEDIEMTPSIMCEAINCKYNSNKECTADNVQIYGVDADTIQETQCETFKIK